MPNKSYCMNSPLILTVGVEKEVENKGLLITMFIMLVMRRKLMPCTRLITQNFEELAILRRKQKLNT